MVQAVPSLERRLSRRRPCCGNKTEEARVRGIVGAPTFFVDTEMFWGNDRLDDSLMFASGKAS
jgi:DSBA-like thioredoxin domain